MASERGSSAPARSPHNATLVRKKQYLRVAVDGKI